MRRRWSVCLALAFLLGSVGAASAQQKSFGGGIAYNIDEPDSAFGLTGVGWIPVNGPQSIPFKPLVLVPRFTMLPGLDYWQVDADMMWDIPLQTEGNIHPYIGMGVGFVHSSFGPNFSDNTPLLNFNAGLRYAKPQSKLQFLIDSHYSSGLEYGNTMHLNFAVLVPFGQ